MLPKLRLAGGAERLEEQVRQLAGQYAREQTQLAARAEAAGSKVGLYGGTEEDL